MSQQPETQFDSVEQRRETAEYMTEHQTNDGDAIGQQPRVLRRSRQDRVIAGVCGGLGRHLDIDPVLFRIAFLLSLLAGGVGLVAYVVFWVAVPEYKSRDEELLELPDRPDRRGRSGFIAGGALILFGVIILLREFIPWFDARVIGALLLIGIGAVIVIRGMQRD